MNLEIIKKHIQEYQDKVKEYNTLNESISVDKSEIEYNTKILDLTNNFIKTYFINNIDIISKIVSSNLEPLFGLKFKFEIDISGSALSVKTLVSEDGESYHEPINSNGGGILDIISLLLRIIFLSKTQNEKILFIDEPFKNISSGYKNVILNVMKDLTDKLKMQLIMVTHDFEFVHISDKIFIINEIPENMVDKIDISDTKVQLIKN